MDDQHIYHHQSDDGPRITVKVEKNTKGYNYEAAVSGALTTGEALLLLRQTVAELETEYGTKSEGR